MHPLLPELSARGDRVALRVISSGAARDPSVAAARLAAQGVRAGDRVALWATPELATIAAVVGNALTGVATVPLNPALGEGELAHVLGDAAPRLVLAADPAPFRARTPGVRGVTLDGSPASPPPPRPDDPLLVLYT